LGARIIAVVDTFDAMTTDRPYRDALSLEEARQELQREKGRQFDPEVVDRFLEVLRESPWE
jgi:HD-GYP domain-containing protein (c-di-GMP phosphodiesterase class II)